MHGSPSEDRWISLGDGVAKVPERLLLAHARGQVLFITGAGTSRPAGLPDFRGLVLDVYEQLDAAVHGALLAASHCAAIPPTAGLSDKQNAEVNRFRANEFDVVLGMLERRMDGPTALTTTVRQKITELLRTVRSASGHSTSPRPAPIHRALMRLADRGGATTIATTNFDLLLEAAAKKGRSVQTHALGGIPRPGRRRDFAGVMHIHGALTKDPKRPSDVVVTDLDFGEFYLRRRVVPDFIYDAARLFHLVLVGYSVSDAPMRYLLNAVAADGSRFGDLKERFAFVAGPVAADQVEMEDWKGRGITPIPYDESHRHIALTNVLRRWAELSPINGDAKKIDSLVKRLVKEPRTVATDSDCDLFDHLFRRSSPSERVRLAALVSRSGAEIEWLDAITRVSVEADKELAW